MSQFVLRYGHCATGLLWQKSRTKTFPPLFDFYRYKCSTPPQTRTLLPLPSVKDFNEVENLALYVSASAFVFVTTTVPSTYSSKLREDFRPYLFDSHFRARVAASNGCLEGKQISVAVTENAIDSWEVDHGWYPIEVMRHQLSAFNLHLSHLNPGPSGTNIELR